MITSVIAIKVPSAIFEADRFVTLNRNDFGKIPSRRLMEFVQVQAARLYEVTNTGHAMGVHAHGISKNVSFAFFSS